MNRLASGVLAGERRAVARAISAVENETGESGAILRGIRARLGRARVIGITGPPGAGKSTLVSALIGELLERSGKIAVVAVDPSSPVSGGAILGDRVRMAAHQHDERVFIRSVASRGHPGGLSRTASRVIDVLDAAGFDTILVETVGAGQGEVEVALLADTRVVVCPPGLGDDIQAIKAGVLEIADLFAVNKSDLPGAERTERELLGMLDLRPKHHGRAEWKPRVVRTVATTGEGVAALADAIEAHRAAGGVRAGRPERLRRLLAACAADWLKSRIENLDSAALDALCERFGNGDIEPEQARHEAGALALATGVTRSTTHGRETGLRLLEFRRERKLALLHDPRKNFELAEIESEIRYDPLTGNSARICHFSLPKLPPPDFAELLAVSRAACPFCPDKVEAITPRFPDDLVPGGRLRRGDAVLFPNLFPYDDISAVAVLAREHFFAMEAVPERPVREGLQLARDFFRLAQGRVAGVAPARGAW